ncbi:hypothetical protein AVEN_265813-1 [Araneus ventricosus]|uniref:Uncharacterized protein n=1 Tax=Araneus ventricosus TaxID=182803 RepID=A0A4Y2DXY1_ARAVE|nr:hypothetical protein AVEN_265813-1 [Araneus ventricosus]
MTRTTPELAPPSPNFRTTPTGGCLEFSHDLACNRPHIQGGSSVKSGFEPGALVPKAVTLPLATQLAARHPVASKTDPKIQHSNNDAMIGIRLRVIADRKSTPSFLPRRSLNPRFPRNKVRPNS